MDFPPSIAVEDALGRDDYLVVVTGPSVRRTAAVVDRAMRRMLGSFALVVITRPHDVDLERVLRLAGWTEPVVVLVPDAPPGMLRQLRPSVRALVGAEVRLVMTARASFLDVIDAVGEVEVADLLREVTLRLPDDGDLGGSNDLLRGLRDTPAEKVARLVADVDRLGAVLPTAALTSLLPGADPRDAGSSASRPVRRAVGAAIRAGLVSRRGDRLVPTPSLVDLAAGPHGWSRPPGLAHRLSDHLDSRARVDVGLVLLGEGKIQEADSLLRTVDRDLVPRPAQVFIAEGFVHLRDWGGVLHWYHPFTKGDNALARRAQRAVALATVDMDFDEAWGRWLDEAGKDEGDAEVQLALARRAQRRHQRDEAVRRLLLAAAGSGDAAERAADDLAGLSVEGGCDAAEPLLRTVVDATDRRRALRARLALIRMLRRQSRGVEALALAEETWQWLGEDDQSSWRAAVARELAALRRNGGDDDGAVAVLRRGAGSSCPAAVAAAAELAIVEWGRGNWEAVPAAFPESTWTSQDARRDPVRHNPDPIFDVVDIAVVVARGLVALAVAASLRSEAQHARTYVVEALRRASFTGVWALRLAQICWMAGDFDEAACQLAYAKEGADSETIEMAAELEARIETQLEQLAAQRAAELAAAPFFA